MAFIRQGEGVPDLVLLDQINEDAVFQNLQLRLSKSQIYTYIGGVVVAMNPFTRLDIYKDSDIKSYMGRYMHEMPPHIYSLADAAFASMLRNKHNHAVIISGESGAGKTEASKIFMNYISAVSGGKARAQQIKDQLLASNPILEALGNAKTVRNDNSSRFGKYMTIDFDMAGAPLGGEIEQYLLEKSRVVKREQDERSFHIFYQLLAGLGAQELGQLGLSSDPMQFQYLAVSNCVKVQSMNDAREFQDVVRSLQTFGFAQEQVNNMWRLLAGILLLGNVKFQPKNGNPSESAVATPAKLRNAAAVLQVPEQMLAKALTMRSITTGVNRRASSINVPLPVGGAAFARDALAKSIYAKMFVWVVEKLNVQLRNTTVPKDQLLSMSILDIYGFEVFQHNGFDQLCINWANEKLQQVFIELTLKTEQEEYVREGIAWTPIEYFNNKTICDLIEKKPIGIIALLDESCVMPNGSDDKFLQKIGQHFKQHKHYEDYESTRDKNLGQHEFRLKHYAGDVQYDTRGFLHRNKDTLFVDLVNTMSSSQNKLLANLFPKVADSKKRPESTGSQFRRAVNELIQRLLTCEPSYIRCVKSNDQRRALYVNEERVRHQIRYLGLVENVRVRRAGFAFRQPYELFLRRYKMLSKSTWPTWHGSARDGVAELMRAQNIAANGFQLGKTKLFLKEPQTLFQFERARDAALPPIIARMQALYRGWRVRNDWRHRRGAIILQLVWRAYKARHYASTLQQTYANVGQEQGVWGANTPWPQAPSVLGRASDMCRKALFTWQAHQKVNALSPSQNSLLRQKVLAYNLFEGKKKWDCTREYEGDYLEKPSNPRCREYVTAMSKLFATYGDTRVLFSDYCPKVNRKHAVQPRAITITERNIYKQKHKNYQVMKIGMPLVGVLGVTLSTFDDSWVIVHNKDPVRDLLLDLGDNNAERASEFVTVLVKNIYDLTGNYIQVNFADRAEAYLARVDNKPTPAITVQWMKDPSGKTQKPTYKKGIIYVP